MSDGEKEDATYTLTLDENTGNVSKVKQITVEYGKRIGDVLYEPEREGYEFAGWFLNKKEIDHNFKWNIEGDATAYAKWVKKGSNDRPGHDDDKDDYHNVDVDLNYDNKMGETVKRVIDGAKMSRVLKYVEEPTRKGYSFAGWYWDAKCKDDVDGDEKVTRDCTIYAKWTRRNSDKEGLLKIYLNENTKAAAKVVDMDAYDNDGKITLTATNNRGWNAYSSVISNTVGGKLIVENGTIEHLGGTDMAYGIDNLTNGKGTYAETDACKRSVPCAAAQSGKLLVVIGGRSKASDRDEQKALGAGVCQHLEASCGNAGNGAYSDSHKYIA